MDITGFDMCMCGEKRCRGSIGGFKIHGEQIKHLYGKYHANYLKMLKRDGCLKLSC